MTPCKHASSVEVCPDCRDEQAEEIERQRDALQAWRWKNERFARIEAAIEQAAGELPDMPHST